MIRVVAKKGQSTEDLIKLFKSKCKKEGIVEEQKRREVFVTRSQRRKEKDKASYIRNHKNKKGKKF